MFSIETTAIVDKEGMLTVQIPPTVTPGYHRVVLVIETQETYSTDVEENPSKKPLLQFPVDDFGPWPEDLSLRREAIYNEWGR